MPDNSETYDALTFNLFVTILQTRGYEREISEVIKEVKKVRKELF